MNTNQCCGSAARSLTIIDHIERGLARRRRPPLPVAGDPQQDAEGRYVRFSLAVADGAVTAAGFEATTCVTLVAYCERLAELVTGCPVAGGAEWMQSVNLAASLPQVPPHKRCLSELAVAGLESALRRASKGPPR